jgi:hypothetical protein
VDVQVCKLKNLKGLFLKHVDSKDNHKQEASTFDPKVVTSNIGL